jgi:hypothetical protein
MKLQRTTYRNDTFSQAATDLMITQNVKNTRRNRINSIAINDRKDLKIKLQKLISRQVGPRDPELVSLVRDLMDPPSKHLVKPVRTVVGTPQSAQVLKVLKGKVSSSLDNNIASCFFLKIIYPYYYQLKLSDNYLASSYFGSY